MAITRLPLNRVLQPQEKIITGNYTLLPTDALIYVNAASNDITVTLPPVAQITHNRPFTIKRVDSKTYTVIIKPTGAENIDGDSTYSLVEGAVTLGTDDTNWRKLAAQATVNTAALVNLGNSARGIQTIKVNRTTDLSSVEILRGSVYIHDGTTENLYSLATDITKVVAWADITNVQYAVYAEPPAVGTTITATQITISQTMPVFSSSRFGYYHPSTTKQRCIGFFRGFVQGVDKRLLQFSMDGNVWKSNGDPINYDVSAAQPSSNWTSYTLSVPIGEVYAIGYAFASYTNADASLKYRRSSADSTNGRSVGFVAANSRNFGSEITLLVNANKQIDLRWDTATTNGTHFWTLGFIVPDFIYTRPAGGIYRQIDETYVTTDNTITNIDHTVIDNTIRFTSSSYGIQSIKIVYKDLTTVTMNPGAVHIYDGTGDGLYSVNTPTDVANASLSATTWYFLYVNKPASGTTIAASDATFSTTVPIEDTTHSGWYHPTVVGMRCIGIVRTVVLGRLMPFVMNGNQQMCINDSIAQTAALAPSNNWTDVTAEAPMGNMIVYAHAGLVQGNNAAILYWRHNAFSVTPIEQCVGALAAEATRNDVNLYVVIDANKLFEHRFSALTTSTVIWAWNGFLLPTGMYTGPAGGAVNGSGESSPLRTLKTITTDYTILSDDDQILIDAAAADLTITLPDAGDIEHRRPFILERIDDASTNVVIVSPDQIDRLETFNFTGGVTVVSDGTSQYSISSGSSSGSSTITKQDVTADYTMTGNEGLVNANGTLTITLPAAAAFNKIIRIANRGTGVVTVVRCGSDTIDGQTSISLASQYATVELISDQVSLWYEF